VIGTTTTTSFVDRSAKNGGHYNYVVVAVDDSGHASRTSNVAAVGAAKAAPTAELDAAVDRLAGGRQHSTRLANVLRLAKAARTTWAGSGPVATLPVLAKLRTAVDAQRASTAKGRQAVILADVREAIDRLKRRATLTTTCGR
jgi:hypothetical protein